MRPEEGSSGFNVSRLPLLVLANAAAFSFVLFGIGLVLLQLHKAPERIEQIAGQAQEYSSILAGARTERDYVTAYRSKQCSCSKPPTE